MSVKINSEKKARRLTGERLLKLSLTRHKIESVTREFNFFEIKYHSCYHAETLQKAFQFDAKTTPGDMFTCLRGTPRVKTVVYARPDGTFTRHKHDIHNLRKDGWLYPGLKTLGKNVFNLPESDKKIDPRKEKRAKLIMDDILHPMGMDYMSELAKAGSPSPSGFKGGFWGVPLAKPYKTEEKTV